MNHIASVDGITYYANLGATKANIDLRAVEFKIKGRKVVHIYFSKKLLSMILGENSPQDKITMFHNRKAMIGFKAGNKNKLTGRNVVVVPSNKLYEYGQTHLNVFLALADGRNRLFVIPIKR
ncbi:hypothetical protein KPA96_13940 [Burkholderia cenocepacia]|uniref:hypothetical protein n=1 Tax=Burkholderia cenocepacia TaxID=95486 RepID=UPI00285BD152|nr:hypothetical protein [Burkholderia cenocepacia]MDR8076759.1 hypothetical protein [Burkholderia cenocepacia]